MGQEIAGDEAPRVFGNFALGFHRMPFEVTRCEIRVKGFFLRNLLPGQLFPNGATVRINPPNMPSIEAIVLDHIDGANLNDDFYILDWRSSRQPRAIPVKT